MKTVEEFSFEWVGRHVECVRVADLVLCERLKWDQLSTSEISRN